MQEAAEGVPSLKIGHPSLAVEESVTPTPALPLAVGYIHLGVAKEIASILRTFGLDADAIITAAGLDPDLFEDGANVIPHGALGRLYALSVARTQCPHFGLLVGQQATISSLGLVGRLMLHSDTFGDALRSLVAYLSVQDRVTVPSLEVEDDTAVLSFATYQPATESADQISDGAIACAVNAIRAVLGEDWAPTEVLLPRSRPTDAQPYRRHFRAPVRFDSEVAALTIPTRSLTLRVAGADPILRAMLEERLSPLQGGHFVDDIRRLLRTRMANDACSAESLADVLAMHRRTLHRRFAAEGTQFRTVVNEVRFEMARQLLTDTNLPLAQIAATLDFSECSAFTRAFRRWSGDTPSAWRVSHRRAGQQSSHEAVCEW
jgi:AraC-like DNA-binding protein